jgi:hypothetical protein
LQSSSAAFNDDEADFDETIWAPPVDLPPGHGDAFAPPGVSEEVWERIGGSGGKWIGTVFYETMFILMVPRYQDLWLAGFPGNTDAGGGSTARSFVSHLAILQAAVPEPASLLLVGTGLILAGLRIRRLPPRALSATSAHGRE